MATGDRCQFGLVPEGKAKFTAPATGGSDMTSPGAGHHHVLHVNPLVPRWTRDPVGILDEWRTLADVARAVAESGCQVTVLQPALEAAELRRDGVRFLFVAEPQEPGLRQRLGFWARPLPARTLEVVEDLEPDVIHFHSLSFPRHLHHVRRRCPDTPVLAQDHADPPPPRWRAVLHRRALKGIGGVAFSAREQAEPFREAGALPERVPIFELLESSSHFRPGDVGKARRRTGLHGDPCLVWLGNLSPVKDPLTILAALASAVERLPDPHLWCFYRSAPLLTEVRERIAGDRHLVGRVHLEGAIPHEEVEERLRAADFLLQGSVREGTGCALIEALACGATPLVTDIPSFRIITDGGRAGALSPVGDAEAMADALVDWAGRDRSRLRWQARHHFEETLAFPVLGRRMRDVYEALITGTPEKVGADRRRAS